jgi:MFS family permease
MNNGESLALLFILLVLVAFVALCMIPVSMAKKRGRSQFGWFLISFFLSPILGVIILACLGETDEKRRWRILEEEELRQGIGRKHANTDDVRPLNPSGRTINDVYKR